eukprot:XP_001693274.1 predicted protein [Chlamydomonas reinhardtii]
MRWIFLGLLALSLVVLRGEHVAGECNFNDASQCTAVLVKNVLEAFATAGLAVPAVNASAEIGSAVSSFTSACLGVQNVLRAVRFLTPSSNDGILASQAQVFTRATGFRAEFSSLLLSRIAEEVDFQLQTNAPANASVAAAMAANSTAGSGSSVSGGVDNAGGDVEAEVAELRAAAERAGTADEDVHPFYRTHAASYLGNRTGVVVSGFMPLLYWRRDIFAARLNLTRPPATWSELLDVGRRLHGTDLNGDGQPDPALCWSSPGCSDVGVLLGALLASLIQHTVAQLRFPRLRGNVGVAALPGSQVVWDREAGAWITCDSAAAACPFADTVPALQLPQLLNGTDNVFFTQLSSPNVSWAQLLDPTSAIGPFRLQHLDPASMGRWRAGGYDNTDLTDFLGAWRTTIEHPNVALLLRMPGAAGLRDALQWAATQRITIAAVVSAVGAALCLAAALGGYAWYRRRQAARHRTLFGRMVAPGASPATCLVVTDIVDSTRLWESVQQLAMARAVQLHHDTLRQLLKETGGYEDSFILSFYGPADAVAFCLRAQAALLACTWPAELLQQELCRPVYAVARSLAPTPPERGRGVLGSQASALSGAGGSGAGGALSLGGRVRLGSTAGVAGTSTSPAGDVLGGAVTLAGVGSAAVAAAAGASVSLYRGGGASPGTGIQDGGTGGATAGMLTGLVVSELQAPPSAAMRPGSSTGMPDQPHSARSQRAGSSGVISAFAAAAGMTANAPTGPAAAGDPNSPGGGVLNAIMRSAGSVTALLSRGGSGGAASRAGTSPSQPGRRLLQTIQHGVGLSSTSSAPQHPLPLLSRSTNPSSWAAAATDVSPPHVLSHSQSQLQSQVQLQIRQQSLASGGSSRRPAPRQGSRLNYINNTPRTNSGSAVTFRSSGVTTAATVGGGGGPDSPVRFRSEAAVAGGPVSGGAVSGLRHLIRTVSGLSSASNSRRSHAMLQRAAGGSGDVGEYQAASLAGAATVAGLVSGPGAVGLGTWSPGRAAGLSPEPSGLDEIMSSTDTHGGAVLSALSRAETRPDGSGDGAGLHTYSPATSPSQANAITGPSPTPLTLQGAACPPEPHALADAGAGASTRTAALSVFDSTAAPAAAAASGAAATTGAVSLSHAQAGMQRAESDLLRFPAAGYSVGYSAAAGYGSEPAGASPTSVGGAAYVSRASGTPGGGGGLLPMTFRRSSTQVQEAGRQAAGGAAETEGCVHAGVEPTEVSYNRVAGRTQYSGTALQFAKVVCDAAQAASRGLLCRVPALGPVRSREQLGAGVLCAPLGCVALGVLVVAGLPTLQAWDKAVTEEALDTFRRVVVTVALRQLGGQLVEEGPGRVLAAFCSAASAVRWAASCEALLKAADWSEALLAHELCPVASAHDDAARCLFRGLRVRGAVDVARVKAELLPATGRLAYRGALAGNVGRMAAFVSVGQAQLMMLQKARESTAAAAGAGVVQRTPDTASTVQLQLQLAGSGSGLPVWEVAPEDLRGMMRRVGASPEGTNSCKCGVAGIQWLV